MLTLDLHDRGYVQVKAEVTKAVIMRKLIVILDIWTTASIGGIQPLPSFLNALAHKMYF